ncbi:MAG TPA: ferritin-like domain-containing protein [Gaiellaceae bacterium]|nr:ferritin-like domain-containing protein [Gaiellaceae bacterium]
MPSHLTRTSFLATLGALALAPSALADAPSDLDLANARLLVAVELLLADFYGRAIKAGRFGPEGKDSLERALFNEHEHYTSVSSILSSAGQTPAVAGDIDFSYPGKAFDTVGATARLGLRLERIALGSYLGAVAAVNTPLKQRFAQIAASEAQHASVFAAETTGHALGNSFPAPLTIDEASDALSEYTG